MIRPPLANLFAVHDADPVALDEMMLDLQRSGEFAHVWRPAPGWVVAAAPLPDSVPDSEAVQRHQLAFAEGRDVLENGFGEAPAERFQRIAEMADFKPDSLASLPGDFGFIRFRPNGSATVVRSCGGLVPFYIGRSGNRIAISTRLGDFVRYLPDEPRLDPLVNAIWASSWCMMPEGRTFITGVSIIGRGCFARIERGSLNLGRYWNPRPKCVSYPTPAMAREHAETLRTLLIKNLKRDLDPAGGNLLTLSGGVDSSSLAALSAGTLGFPIWTWSLLPSKEQERSLQHQLSYIEPLAKQYGFECRWSVFYHDKLVFDLWRAAPRIVFHVLHPALCSLPGILREAPVRVLFGGEYADNVCGSTHTVPDWVAHTSLMRQLTVFQTMFKSPKNVARWAKHCIAGLLKGPIMPYPEKLLEMGPDGKKQLNLFRPEVQEEYRCWWEGRRQELMRDTDAWPYLWLNSTSHDGFVAMNWEACSALGIRRSLPFFTREVFELAFSCHPTELYGFATNATKKLIRLALKDDVPERNLFRPDKGMGRWASQARDASRNFRRLWQEPMPKEELPEDLGGILREEWFSHPPEKLEYGQYRPLTRLLIFIESLRLRRQISLRNGGC